jgi:hypothetical protein
MTEVKCYQADCMNNKSGICQAESIELGQWDYDRFYCASEEYKNFIEEKCPQCGSQLHGNMFGYIWCSSTNCNWKNSED